MELRPRRAVRFAWVAASPTAGVALLAGAVIGIAGCAGAPPRLGDASPAVRPPADEAARPDRDGPEAKPPPGLAALPDAEPKLEPIRVGGPNKPYEIAGTRYVPLVQDLPFVQRGLASWYGRKFHGARTSSGERYDMYAMTAAHPTLPIPSYARIRNPANGREVVVRINDRGPFHSSRVIDLSYTAALKLDLLANVGPVEIRRVTGDEIRAAAERGGLPVATASVPGLTTATSNPATATPSPTTATSRLATAASSPATAASSLATAAPSPATGTSTPATATSSLATATSLPVTAAPSLATAAVAASPLAVDPQPPPVPAIDPIAAVATAALPVLPPTAAGPPPSPVPDKLHADAAPGAAVPLAGGPVALATPTAPVAAGWWIQLGAFRAREGAVTLQQRLEAEQGWIAPLLAVFHAAPYFRLQAGPYPERGAAEQAAERVRRTTKALAWIVERP